jgi:hypothetical protein
MLPPVNTTIASVGLRQLRSWWGRKPDQPRKLQQPHDGTCDRDAAQGALRQRYCRAPGHLLELRHIVGSISYRQTFAEPRCDVAEKRNLARFTRLRAAGSELLVGTRLARTMAPVPLLSINRPLELETPDDP